MAAAAWKLSALGATAFQAAAANADWAKAEGYYLILTNQAGATSWPITGASFILVYKTPDASSNVVNAASINEALKFFSWAYANGTAMATDLDYVPLPAALIAQVKKSWATQVVDGGHPVYGGK